MSETPIIEAKANPIIKQLTEDFAGKRREALHVVPRTVSLARIPAVAGRDVELSIVVEDDRPAIVTPARSEG